MELVWFFGAAVAFILGLGVVLYRQSRAMKGDTRSETETRFMTQHRLRGDCDSRNQK